jgi:hypothetical protein
VSPSARPVTLDPLLAGYVEAMCYDRCCSSRDEDHVHAYRWTTFLQVPADQVKPGTPRLGWEIRLPDKDAAASWTHDYFPD